MTSDNPRRSALIDLGTNSARLLIVEVGSDGLATIMHQEKIPVRLGEGSFLDKRLTEEAMSRTIAALDGFLKTARAFQVDYMKAVATSATREADNRDYFVNRVYEETGLWLKVVSGLEEARLIYLGISRNLNLGPKPSLMVDIGGGSVELIVGNKDNYTLLDSMPLGAARLAALFDLGAGEGVVEEAKYLEMVDYAARRTRRFVEEAGQSALSAAYGSSGTIENLTSIHFRRSREGAGEPRPEPAAFLPAADLRALGLWLGSMDLKSRRKVSGLDNQKAPIIVAGCAVLDALLPLLGLAGLTAVNYGLKHGLLYEFAAEHQTGDNGLSTRENSLRGLGRRCRYEEDHALATAAWTAVILAEFVGCGLLEKDDQEAELIRLAALVHDIGKFLAYEKHQIHSWYLIKNASLMGFDEDEIDLMAYLALNHRRKRKIDGWPYCLYSNQPRDPHRRKLAFVLRLAELVDSSRQGVVKSLKLQKYGTKVNCFLETGGNVECQEVGLIRKLAKDFAQIFDLHLLVTAY